jgi:pSer/pThr/pTyr-binding forkhead associated (FHA) protein
MQLEIEELLREASRDIVEKIHQPRDVYARLHLVASLLRDAPPASHGRLLWRDRRGAVRSRFVDRELIVGRGSDCDVAIEGDRVTRRHCAVRLRGGEVEVADLGSANGTFVNGVRVQRQPLHDGDVIAAGGAVVAFARG